MRRRFPARDRVAAPGRDQLKGDEWAEDGWAPEPGTAGPSRTGAVPLAELASGHGDWRMRYAESAVAGPDRSAGAGDWLSGRALPSHGRGHWFESSIAHQRCHCSAVPDRPHPGATDGACSRFRGIPAVAAHPCRSGRDEPACPAQPLRPRPSGRAPPAARLRAAPSGPAPPPRPASPRKSRPPFSAPGQGMMINGHGGWMPWPAPCIRPGPNQAAMAGYAILCVTRY
jgi:hypothetical protein